MMDTIHNYQNTYWEDVAKRNEKYSPQELLFHLGCDLVQLYCKHGSNQMREDVPRDVAECLFNAYHIAQEIERKCERGEPFLTDDHREWRKQQKNK